MKTKNKFDEMTKTPVEKLIGIMAIPAIVGMLITTIYNMADTYFVGKISTNAIAAVGVAYSFMSIVQAFGFLCGHGSGNYISKKLGEQDKEAAEVMASTGITVSISMGIVLMVFTLLFAGFLARILGATILIREDTTHYLQALAMGIPFMTGALTLNNQLRFQGKAFWGMIGIGFGGIMNMVLDPIMIFVLHIGVSGAGYATAISQMFSFFFLLYLNGKGESLSISIRKCKLDKALLGQLIWGGMPNFCRQGIASFAGICLNLMAALYGEVTIAGFTIVNRLVMMTGAAMIGFGQGFQPVCAYNFGAALYKRVKRAFYFTVGINTIFAMAMLGVILKWTPQIVGIFTNETQTIEVGIEIICFQLISMPILGWVIVSGMFLQNISRFKQATIVAVARQGICFLPLVLILPRFLGVTGVMLSQPIADIATFVISLPLTIKAIRELK